MFLYLIRNKRDGKEYVGTTTRSLSLRMSDHRYRAKNGARQSPLYEAIREDGINNFLMELLAIGDSYEELLEKEQREIRERNTLHPHGYNLVKGGRGNYGWQMKDETRQKIAAKATGRIGSMRGRKMTDEQRANVRRSRIARHERERMAGIVRRPWNKGCKATPEMLVNMAVSKNEEWRAKQAASHRGRTMPQEQRDKIAASMRALRKERFWSTRPTGGHLWLSR